MRDLNKFIVHCSDSPNEREVTAAEIDRWHKERGWTGIGYHFVIRRSGLLELGRPLEQIGSHVQGHNKDSIGVCMVGRNRFTPAQYDTLKKLWAEMRALYPKLKPYGHRDFTTGKTCPNFDVSLILK